jgi:mono/diheme cytochrome c family protein
MPSIPRDSKSLTRTTRIRREKTRQPEPIAGPLGATGLQPLADQCQRPNHIQFATLTRRAAIPVPAGWPTQREAMGGSRSDKKPRPNHLRIATLIRRATLVLFAITTLTHAEDSFFTEKIIPLLEQKCVSCHNSQKLEGDLNLTTREMLIQGGETGPGLVPGKPDDSRLLKIVSGPKYKMPKEGKHLSDEQIADLKSWIEQGAPWTPNRKLQIPVRTNRSGTDFWSYQPLKKSPVPDIADANAKKWIRNPVDAFLLAKMTEKGVAPAPEAPRATQIRRLSYDLIGLPPTPEEIDAFVNDTSPDAYEKLVDRLLASPRYGERWARHWLDVAHYGDTHGYDKDKRRNNAWPYRDYVIRAFNDDKPYSQFVREQLAGDVLKPGDPDGVIATGFISAGPWDLVGHTELAEGTTDKKITRSLDRDDMVASTAATFLSMTVHCARCHDHKFDPIAQKDYYQLQADFAGVERGDRAYGEPSEISQKRAELEKSRRELTAKRDQLAKTIATKKSPELSAKEDELKKLNSELNSLALPAGAQNSPTNGYHGQIFPSADTVQWVQVDFGATVPLDEIRLIPARPTDFRDSPGFGFPQRFKIELSDDEKFFLAETIDDHTKEDFPNPGDTPHAVRPPDGKKWAARFVRVTATRQWQRSNDWVFALAELQAASGGKNVALAAKVSALDSIEAGRWSTRHLVDGFSSRVKLPAWPDAASVAVTGESKEIRDARRRKELEDQIARLEKERQALADTVIGAETKTSLQLTEAALKNVDAEIKSLPPQRQVYAAVPRPPREIQILKRGNVTDPGEDVGPGALSLLNAQGLACEFKVADKNNEGQRRAALADWIADPRNVLARRSIVNRLWHYHFGKGIVDSPNDFGYNGGRPTHPELLDWLALNFLENGESFKKFHKLLVTSAAYRQSSESNPAFEKIDADNRLLWRANRRRLDAESLRDSVLAISGKLDLKMFGPGYDLFAFKDDHSPVYDYATFSKTEHPETFRRTIYRFAVRSVPNPFLDCLDCADPNLNTHVRNTTNTALQALAMLNDPFLIRQSQYLAEKLTKQTSDSAEQIALAYKSILGRAPSAEEKSALQNYAAKRGLNNACRMLLNTNEFMFVD